MSEPWFEQDPNKGSFDINKLWLFLTHRCFQQNKIRRSNLMCVSLQNLSLHKINKHCRSMLWIFTTIEMNNAILEFLGLNSQRQEAISYSHGHGNAIRKTEICHWYRLHVQGLNYLPCRRRRRHLASTSLALLWKWKNAQTNNNSKSQTCRVGYPLRRVCSPAGLAQFHT